jgi:hypothetical protein
VEVEHERAERAVRAQELPAEGREQAARLLDDVPERLARLGACTRASATHGRRKGARTDHVAVGLLEAEEDVHHLDLPGAPSAPRVSWCGWSGPGDDEVVVRHEQRAQALLRVRARRGLDALGRLGPQRVARYGRLLLLVLWYAPGRGAGAGTRNRARAARARRLLAGEARERIRPRARRRAHRQAQRRRRRRQARRAP